MKRTLFGSRPTDIETRVSLLGNQQGNAFRRLVETILCNRHEIAQC